jgi:hydroxyacylglutathione hydrolase
MKTDVHVHAIPAFSDNYIWMMHDGRNAVVVDPGAAEPVEATLAQMGLSLNAIVLTHLHYDHCWGVPGLLEHRSVPVYGPVLNDLRSRDASAVSKARHSSTGLRHPSGRRR